MDSTFDGENKMNYWDEKMTPEYDPMGYLRRVAPEFIQNILRIA